MRIVASITHKRFLTEMDLLRLQKALLLCRMLANSTSLADKEPPGFSSKLARSDELIGQLFEESGRKVVLFSEWTTMLNLIEPLLNKNVDLPWNPAVLEQRIARAHRMGQTQSVQVFVLVTEQTIEENLLSTIAAKKDLALAALDVESEVDEAQLQSGLQELKSRLEVLLGSRPESPLYESQRDASTNRFRGIATPSANALERQVESCSERRSSYWVNSSRTSPRLYLPRTLWRVCDQLWGRASKAKTGLD